MSDSSVLDGSQGILIAVRVSDSGQSFVVVGVAYRPEIFRCYGSRSIVVVEVSFCCRGIKATEVSWRIPIVAKVSKRQRLDEANSLTDRRSRHKVEAQENDIVRYRKMSVQGIQRRRSSVESVLRTQRAGRVW